MPIKADFHLHSNFSGDCKIPMEEMIQQGIKQGLEIMCFTEHHDDGFPYTHGEPTDMFTLNADSYLYELIRLKNKYENQISIRFGLELGIQLDYIRSHLLFTKAHEYDFIIGSSHLCQGRDPYFPDFYDGRSEEDAYREYFISIYENIKRFKNFDVYGHLYYIVRYGPNKNKNYSYSIYADIIDSILKLLIDNGKGIEINTGGFRNDLGSPNPCIDIIQRYKELGGEIITIGSDAHTPEHIAFSFDIICEQLKALGYKYYTVFDGRMPEYKLL